MKPAIRNVFSLCGAIVVQVCGFHVEWQAMSHIMDIVKMKGMACQTPEDPVVKMTCLSTMWASSKGIEAMGFVKNQDCVTENITSMAQAGESQRESDQQDCAAITENMTSLAETKSKARVMVDCSTLDCVVDGMPALNQRCCQKQSCVKEYTKKMGGGQSNLFGCDTWWLWLVISICVVQGCWKWTDGGSVPWGRGWLTMASLVAVAEGLADTWYELSPTGGISISHYYGASVWSTIDNRMYVFGGYTGSTGSYINTLIAYDPQANAWETISPSSGTAPSARAYHTGVWDWTNGRMWIFGGASNGVKYNDLHYYDVQANQWVEVTPGGTAPTARTVHAAGFDSTNGRMWVFGGHDGSRRNDLHFYDVTANEWVEVTPGGTAPTAREGHAAGFDSTNGRMWVFGGLDGPFDGSGSRQNDLHYYDVTANEWVEVTPGGTAPTARYAQRAEWDDAGGRLWIFAGNTDTGAVNDLFYYDLQANAWVEVTPGGVTPGVRIYHHLAIDASAGRLYIYAGDGDGGVSLLYVEIEDPTTTTTVSSSATRTSTSSATRTITTTTSQTISSTTTGTASTTGTTTTRTGSTTTTASSSTSISTTTSSSTSTSATTSSSTSTSTTTSSSMSTSTTASRSASTSSTISTSSTTTTSITTSTSTSTTSTSTSRSATTSSSSTRSTSISSSSTTSTTATSTSTSKTMSTTSSTSTTTTTRTQSSTTTATATDSTTTTSSISSSTTSPTTTTKTGTAIPEGGLTIEELEVLEEKRKEEAAQAVAAVEAAENNAVAEAIAAIALQGNASASAPGILGEVTISSEAGPVKVAALSLEALGNDSVPVKVSAGETGAELEVSAGLLGDVVLLSVAGLPQDAAARLATDDVRAESPDPGPPGPGGARRLASALRSQPLSINFRAADGTKINVTNLTTPMKMTLTVEDPTATCAFWDGATAQWSAKGVQTIPSEIPGILECETTHLSIFGGVVDVALRNVILALECSTVGAVLTPEAMAKMVEDGEWLGRPATLVTLAVAVGFLGLLKLALRSDQRFKETLPWDEREDFLMCVKAKASPQDPREGAAGAGAADAVEQPPQNEAEQHGKTNDKGADEVQRDRDEQPRENRGDEEVKSEEKEEEEKKDEAAGGLEKLPSIFRTVRGIVEGLLDTISQALGGENVLYSIKEIISNAESGAIHRAIASLQSHRSGADQATVRALQRGVTSWVNEEALDADAEGERRRDATSVRIEGSAEDLPLEGEESVPVADEAFGRRQRSAAEIEVQPMNPEDFADRREVSPVHEAAPVRKDGAAEVQGESRCGRRPPPPCLLLQQRAEEKEEEEEEELTQNLRSHDRQPRPRASMIEMIGAAFRAAQRRSAALFAKARAMHGRLAEDGAGAAKRYLESNFFGRVFMLFPAVHNWLKLSQFSIVVPCIIRTELIELKVWSCAFLNAVFFSSTLPPPDSDPACRPESGSVAYWAQKFTVGTVSATVGDFIILLLFLMVRIRIEERDEWTDEDKTERRKWWRNRTIAFWFIAVLYKSFCIFYVCAFIANVSKEDANQLLEATAMSLLQDLVLKPAILALILAVVSTLVLTCRPSIKRNIQAKWMEDRSVEHVAAKDSRGSPIPSEFCEANDVKEVPESLTPAPEPVEPPTLLDIGSSINRFKDWPFHVEEGDGHQPIRPIRPVRDPNEAQFASVLPGMPGP